MKIQPKLVAALAALLILSNILPVYAENVDSLPEESTSSQDNTLISDASLPEKWESVSSGDHFPSSGDTPEQEPFSDKTEDSGMTVPDEAPMFSAYVAYTPQGFVVKGTFTELLADTSLIKFLYSLDGEVWQAYDHVWTSAEDNASQIIPAPTAFQNLVCLHDGFEPLSGYIAGQYDRFYLKLQITLKNGLTYETQAAIIDRNDPLMISEELTPVVGFTSTLRILQRNPLKLFGQYQITVRADATPEDISALLPDTLPMEVQLFSGNKIVTKAIVDCPITWKSLSLPQLTSGESVTIADAAEEIIIPAGTLLNTPTGVFQLNEPLGIAQDDIVQNEIRLILNVVSENADPTGVLVDYNDGLKAAFHLKPTGATAIRAYTLLDGEEDWVELPDSLPLEEVNAPSSIANSAYTFILRNASEPYQSYLAARNAGDEPVPFLVGLKVEGGVYDGRQLILAWPDTYERLATLPSLNGYGGNEGNAGSDNKNDSTPEGQRPSLPQSSNDGQDAKEPEPTQSPVDGQDAKEPEPTQSPGGGQDAKEPQTTQSANDGRDVKEPQTAQSPSDGQDVKEPQTTQNPSDGQDVKEPQTTQTPNDEQDKKAPELPQTPNDGQDAKEPQLPQTPNDGQDVKEPQTTQIPNDEQNTKVLKLPQTPNDGQNAKEPELLQTPSNRQDAKEPELPQVPNDGQDAKEPETTQTSNDGQDIKEPELPQTPNDGQDAKEPETTQTPKNEQDVQDPKPYIPETQRERQTGISQTSGEQQTDTTPPILIAGAGNPEAVPGGSAKTYFPTEEKNALRTQHNLPGFLLPAAAIIIAIGLCIAAAARKAMAGNLPGKSSGKVIRAICKYFHLK